MSGSFHFSFFVFWSISCHFQAKCGFLYRIADFFQFLLLWPKSEKRKNGMNRTLPYDSRTYWIAWINATSERFWSNCDVLFCWDLKHLLSLTCALYLRDSNNLLNIWLLTYLFSRIKLKDVRADTGNRDTKYSKLPYARHYNPLLNTNHTQRQNFLKKTLEKSFSTFKKWV